MDKERFEHVLICSQDFEVERFRPLVKDLVVLEMGRAIGPKDVTVTLRLIKLLWRYRPDVVYCHSSKAGAVGRAADFFCPGKVVYNAHGWAFNMKVHKRLQKLYQWVERLCVPFCKRIVCISNYERQSALDRHVGSERKLKVIFNGVEIEDIRRNVKAGRVTREQMGIPEGVPVVGMIGRISSQKAPDIFVRMAERVSRVIPEAHFVIVGDGQDRALIDRMISDRGMEDRFHITGWISNPNDYMALFDVGTLMSRWEGFGLVLCEYMAAGIPLVSTRIDAIPDLVEDGVNGLLVDMDNDVKAAECVVRILQDAQLRQRLVENGTRVVEEKFDISRVAREHEAMFEEMVR